MVRPILVVCAALALLTCQVRPDSAAAAVEVNTWERFLITETTCTGERVTLDTRVHFVRHATDGPSDSIISGSHLAAISGSAITASGTKYLLRDGSNSIATGIYSDGGTELFTSTIRLRLIRAGDRPSDDDLYFRAVFHYTFTTNGDVTAQFDNVSEFECR